MKRFTKRADKGVAICRVQPYITPFVNETEVVCGEAIDRLAELEDKLESGQLVELPCKVGDAIWVIDYDEDIASYVCIGGNSSFLFLSPTIYAGKDISTPEELCDYYVDCYMEDGSDADVVIFPRSKCFTDKSQAEARLKELQEQKNG